MANTTKNEPEPEHDEATAAKLAAAQAEFQPGQDDGEPAGDEDE